MHIIIKKSVQETKVSYERLDSIMSIPVETVGNIELSRIETICTKSLSLSENGKAIVFGLNACFETGHIYSIRGLNGSGKSTFINLLMGLYMDEYEGEILINNLPLKEVNMYSIRQRNMGVFEQNPVLFEDTIAYNVHLNQEACDTDIIKQVIDVLGLRDFLYNLPKGLDTVLYENAANISGGEKQKIALLRAIIKNPDVLMLDEPTSDLDDITTRRLIEYLKSIKGDKIIIIVSHDDEVAQIADKTIWRQLLRFRTF
ncbi:MAG: ATP-binding cassette domain-containing protein [Sphaerochaetaceae bacterium]